MDNNEFNRRLRYALRLDDAETQRLLQLGGQSLNLEQVSGYRCKEGEAGYLLCPDFVVIALLDALVLDRRGPPPVESPSLESSSQPVRLSNNLVLKQLRIALSLRSDDVQDLINEGGGRIGKSEIGAFFRSPDARNYRRVGDQLLRWFLSGLAARRDTSSRSFQ